MSEEATSIASSNRASAIEMREKCGGNKKESQNGKPRRIKRAVDERTSKSKTSSITAVRKRLREVAYLAVALVSESAMLRMTFEWVPMVAILPCASACVSGADEVKVSMEREGVVRVAWRGVGVDARAPMTVDVGDCDGVAAMRSCGLVTAGYLSNVVRVHRADFSVAQTLGEVGVAGSDAGHFDRPRGVVLALADTALVVVDELNHRVVLFGVDDRREAYVRVDAVESRGSCEGQFACPVGATMSGARMVWVADNERLVCLAVRGSGVAAVLRFHRYVPLSSISPWYVAFNGRSGKFIVSGEHEVFVVDVDTCEVKERRIGYDGALSVKSAYDIVCGGHGAVYVVDSNSGDPVVKILDGSGSVVGCMPAPGAWCLTITPTGRLFFGGESTVRVVSVGLA